MTFDKFDTYGGDFTLTSVFITVFFDTQAGALLQIDNEDEDPTSGLVELGAEGAVTSEDVRLTDADLAPWSGPVSAISSKTMTLAADDGDDPDTVQTDGEDYDFLETELISDSSSAYLASGVFSDFVGAGTYDLNFSASQYVNYSALGGVSYSGTPIQTTGSVVVQYGFIPEPSTAILVCAVFGVAAFIRRRL